jgi:hypothetical protein
LKDGEKACEIKQKSNWQNCQGQAWQCDIVAQLKASELIQPISLLHLHEEVGRGHQSKFSRQWFLQQ